jgi:hypothetical protein
LEQALIQGLIELPRGAEQSGNAGDLAVDRPLADHHVLGRAERPDRAPVYQPLHRLLQPARREILRDVESRLLLPRPLHLRLRTLA